MKLPKPTHEIFCSTDSCNEHYGWEEADNLTQRQFDRCTDPRDHRYIYTKEQVIEILEAAAMEAFGADHMGNVNLKLMKNRIGNAIYNLKEQL